MQTRRIQRGKKNLRRVSPTSDHCRISSKILFPCMVSYVNLVAQCGHKAHTSSLLAEYQQHTAAQLLVVSVQYGARCCQLTVLCLYTAMSQDPLHKMQRNFFKVVPKLLQGCAARPRYFKQPPLAQCSHFWNPKSMISWP